MSEVDISQIFERVNLMLFSRIKVSELDISRIFEMVNLDSFI